MMDPLVAAPVFLAGAGTFVSGYLLGTRTSHRCGHYRGVQDALDALGHGRDEP